MLSFGVLSRMRYLQAGSFLLCIILLISCCTVLMPSFSSAAAFSQTAALDEGANLLPLTQQEISTTKSLTAAAAAAAGAWITKGDDDLHETGGIITGSQGVVGSSYSAPKEEADEYSSGTTKSFCSRCSRLEEGAGTELQQQQQQEERAGETATTLQQQAANGGLKGSPKPSSIESSDLVKTLNEPTKARSSRFRNRRMLDPNQVCTNKDVSIFQGQVGFSGIPQYIVQIVNTCMSDCAPSDIHVYCGWFASAMLVNPSIFSRVAFNDCLVNGGRPLRQGDIIRFEYANSFMYPIRFKSASFC
ncbi:hypothetical protein CY35_19G007800 [Sphagnum magellanicum]|nr:hypothetical protein CY35_19G007800 [Sphagnum magellanicum]